MRKKIPPGWILPLLFLFFILVVILSILKKSNFDVFLVIIFSIPVLAAGYDGIRTNRHRRRILSWLISFFILFHCLLFPFIYKGLLDNDPASMAIDNQIATNEKKNAMAILDSEYQPKVVQQDIKVIGTIIRTSDSKLGIPMTVINAGAIAVLDSFLISGYTYSCMEPPGIDPAHHHSLCITDKNGHSVVQFPNYDELFAYKSLDVTISLGTLLTKIADTLHNISTTYSRTAQEFSHQKGIWTFSRILPYCLNAFTSGNLRPISRTANYLYIAHAILFWVITLCVIASFIALLLDEEKKTDTLGQTSVTSDGTH